MKVLTIGTDRKLFEEGSAVLLRNLEYASNMEELHIIVFSLGTLTLIEKHIGNLHIYPTNSISRLLYIFDAIKIGKKIIKNSHVDVISSQDPFECGLVGFKLAKRFCLPLQLQIHTDIFSSYFQNSFLNRIRVVIAKFIIPRVKALRVVGSAVADSVRRQFPKLKAKIDILPVFVDMEKILSYVPNPNKDAVSSIIDFSQFERTVLVASRLEKEKKIDVALCAFKKVLEKFPKTGLVIVGSGTEESHLRRLAKKMKILNKVIFLGWQKDLISLYKTADVFLLTSEYEGYGMTLVEAGLSGCPMVTTQVGLAKTSLFKNDENAFVCPVGDVECITKRLIELLNSKEKRQLFKDTMQSNIRSITLSKEEYTNQYIALLKSIII